MKSIYEDSIQIACSCHAPFHRVEFMRDHDPHDDSNDVLYVQYQLLQYRSLFQRIVVAVKYVLGYPERYGCWDVTEVSQQEAEKLRDWLIKNT